MKKMNKGREFGSKMEAFLHSYSSSTSSIPSKTPKPIENTLKPYN